MSTDKNPQGTGRSAARAQAAKTIAAQKRKEQRRSMLIQVGIVAVVAVVIIGGAVFAVLNKKNEAPVTVPPQAGFNAEAGISIGDTKAPVKVTLVEDFACPVCQAFENLHAEQITTWASGTDVQIEYRPIAFLDSMSTGKGTDMYSSRALNAAACVVDEDPKNWGAIHAALYAEQPAENGPGLTDAKLVELATQAGMPKAEATTCIDDQTNKKWVTAATDRMKQNDWWTGTPTVLIDGKKLTDNGNFVQAVEDAVKAK